MPPRLRRRPPPFQREESPPTPKRPRLKEPTSSETPARRTRQLSGGSPRPAPPAPPPPRPRGDPSAAEMARILGTGRTDAERADLVLDIMRQFPRGAIILRQVLKRMGLNVSFPQVEYDQIAPMMGVSLDLPFPCPDSPSFVVKRARLPERKFKAICDRVQMVVMEYGPPFSAGNEETKSRFLAPVSRTATRTHSPSSIQHVRLR
jgi:hypothetical protein